MIQEIAAGRAPDEIAPTLAERFEAPDGKIAAEVNEFIAELRAKGLVEG